MNYANEAYQRIMAGTVIQEVALPNPATIIMLSGFFNIEPEQVIKDWVKMHHAFITRDPWYMELQNNLTHAFNEAQNQLPDLMKNLIASGTTQILAEGQPSEGRSSLPDTFTVPDNLNDLLK
jgi:hypothetical protein